MAIDHGCELGRDRVEVEIGNVVQQPEQQLADFDHLGRGQARCPLLRVDIAAHRKRRRKRAQCFEHLGPADVAGMDDELRPAQRRNRFGAQQPVRI